MIKKYWSLLTVLIIATMVLSACATATTEAPAVDRSTRLLLKHLLTPSHRYHLAPVGWCISDCHSGCVHPIHD